MGIGRQKSGARRQKGAGRRMKRGEKNGETTQRKHTTACQEAKTGEDGSEMPCDKLQKKRAPSVTGVP